MALAKSEGTKRGFFGPIDGYNEGLVSGSQRRFAYLCLMCRDRIQSALELGVSVCFLIGIPFQAVSISPPLAFQGSGLRLRRKKRKGTCVRIRISLFDSENFIFLTTETIQAVPLPSHSLRGTKKFLF